MQNAHHEKDLFLRRFANDQFDLTILIKKSKYFLYPKHMNIMYM